MENQELFSIWRLYDNNNHFERQKYLSKKEAEEIRQKYENLGHKQLYYIEKTTEKNTEKLIDKISLPHVQ